MFDELPFNRDADDKQNHTSSTLYSTQLMVILPFTFRNMRALNRYHYICTHNKANALATFPSSIKKNHLSEPNFLSQ